MIDSGEDAPAFEVPRVADEIEPYTLSEATTGGPAVLAFFPGAFTGTCTAEMNAFQERLDAFEAADATLLGASVDTPFSLREFRDRHGLEFGLLSDSNKELIDAYGVRMDMADIGYYGVADRAVFVIDSDGTVTYDWIAESPGVEPNYDDVIAAAETTE